jgi:hypothetical protein
LLLELIRESEPVPLEVILSHDVGLPVIDYPENCSAYPLASTPNRSSRYGEPHNSHAKDVAPIANLIQEFVFPTETHSFITLLLPPQSMLIPALQFTIPPDVAFGEVIRLHVVARRPEDGFLVGGMSLIVSIEP